MIDSLNNLLNNISVMLHSIVIVLEANNLISKLDKDYIHGNIPYTEYLKLKESENE